MPTPHFPPQMHALPCPVPSPPTHPMGPLVHLDACCEHPALTCSSRRQPTLVGPLRFLAPLSPLIPQPSPKDPLLAGWSSLKFAGECTPRLRKTQTFAPPPAPGTWTVTHGPAPDTATEPSLTPVLPSSWFLGDTPFPRQCLVTETPTCCSSYTETPPLTPAAGTGTPLAPLAGTGIPIHSSSCHPFQYSVQDLPPD